MSLPRPPPPSCRPAPPRAHPRAHLHSYHLPLPLSPRTPRPLRHPSLGHRLWGSVAHLPAWAARLGLGVYGPWRGWHPSPQRAAGATCHGRAQPHVPPPAQPTMDWPAAHRGPTPHCSIHGVVMVLVAMRCARPYGVIAEIGSPSAQPPCQICVDRRNQGSVRPTPEDVFMRNLYKKHIN